MCFTIHIIIYINSSTLLLLFLFHFYCSYSIFIVFLILDDDTMESWIIVLMMAAIAVILVVVVVIAILVRKRRKSNHVDDEHELREVEAHTSRSGVGSSTPQNQVAPPIQDTGSFSRSNPQQLEPEPSFDMYNLNLDENIEQRPPPLNHYQAPPSMNTNSNCIAIHSPSSLNSEITDMLQPRGPMVKVHQSSSGSHTKHQHKDGTRTSTGTDHRSVKRQRSVANGHENSDADQNRVPLLDGHRCDRETTV